MAGAGASDTIAALATARGPAGVAVVRVSGPEAVAIVAAVVGRAPDALAPRRLVRAVARDEDGARLDDVLVVAMPGPRSFTGEDVAELHGHGGTVNAGRLLRAVLARGARLAEPGEFTRRAVERGRMSVAEAEGLLGVIEAASERGWRVAQAQLGGALGVAVARARSEGTGVLAELEAALDFPDEDLDVSGAEALAARADVVAAEGRALVEGFRLGRALRDGLEVALVGPVNAGKSSLFNALVGRERSLVAAEPGTTRDYLEARVEWSGIAVTLIDTAGERDADGAVERRGIELGRARSREADVRVWVCEDGVAGERADVVVRSKCDLAGVTPAGVVATSARTGEGLDRLRDAVLAAALPGGAADEVVVVTTERQRAEAARVASCWTAVADGLRTGRSAELVAVDARDGLRALSALAGDEVGEAVLDALFARFCIGK